MAKLKDGFYKQTAEDIGSDLYVLLAGGGSKALSDFAYKSDLTGSVIGGPYIPLSGTANLSGPIVMSGISNPAPFIRNFTHEGDSGWAREIMDILVDGSSKFKIGAYGSYINGESNGIIYAYLGCNSYDGLNLRITASSLNWGDNIVLHSDNYNSYSPTLTGTGASGTWGINISGTAANADTVDGYHAGLANGNVALYVPFPNSTTLKDKGYISTSYGTDGYGYPDDEFLKGICKWAIDTYTNQGDITLMGVITPSSSGTCILHLYSSSGKDSTTGLPRWCRGQYLSLSGPSFHFGTTDYVWAYNRFAFAYELKNPTDYYWANVPVSATSNAATSPTFASAVATNHINIGYTLGQNIPNRAELSLISPGAYPVDIILGADSTKYWSITARNSTDSNSKGFGIYDWTAGDYRLVINSSGYVGIGTLIPRSTLDVYGNDAAVIIGKTGNNHGASTARKLRLGLGTAGHSGSEYWAFCIDDTTDSSYLQIGYTEDIVGISIRHDGFLGVGTNYPYQRLTVNGNIAFTSTGIIGASYDNSNTNMYNNITISSNVDGIRYSSGGWTGGNHIAHNFLTGNSDSSRLIIMNDGSIGIGTTSPAYKLDVAGTIGSTSNIINTSIFDHATPVAQCLVINSTTIPSGVPLTLKNSPGIGFHIASTSWASLVYGYEARFNFINSTADGYAPVAASSFIKADSTDDYVLLGGGGHKAESSLSVSYASIASSADSANYLHINDVREASRSPNYFPPYSLYAWFNNVGVPINDWCSGIHVKGWHDGYASWELSSYSSTGTSNNYGLYFRNGINDTWGDWREVVDSGNYSSVIGSYYISSQGMMNSAYACIPTYNGETGWHRIATIKGSVGYGSYILYLCGTYSYASNTNVIIHIDTMCTTAQLTQVSGIVGYVNSIRLVNISDNEYYVDVHINYTGANTPGSVHCYFLGNGTITPRTTAEKITSAVTASDELALANGGFSHASAALKDTNDGKNITACYSTGGFSSNPSWLAAWNGYHLTYVSPSVLNVNYATTAGNANTLDGIDSTGFFISNKGSVSVPYIDLTTYTSNHSDYKNYDSGTYTVARSEYTDTYIVFKSSGSTSAIELMSNYNDTSRLKLRKTIDSNRVSGPWRELAFTSDIPTVSNSNGYVPRFVSFPAHTSFGSSTDTYDYLKNIVKWIYDNANYGDRTYLMGVGNPNSLGMMNIQLYGNSGKNSDGWPRYCSGTFLNLGDSAFEIFGTNDYNYYRCRLSVDGHGHRITKLHRRDSSDDYSLQHHWTGSYWYLKGYYGDTYHAGVQVAYADSASTAGSASSANVATEARVLCADDTMKLYAHYSNEINFGGSSSSGTIHFGCRATDSKPIPEAFVFGGSTGTASITASTLIATCSNYGTVKIYGTSGGNRMIEDLGTTNGFYIKTSASWGMILKVNTNEVVIGNDTKAMYTNQALDLGTSSKPWGNIYGTLKGDADTVDGYHIQVVSSLPASRTNNTIYIVI